MEDVKDNDSIIRLRLLSYNRRLVDERKAAGFSRYLDFAKFAGISACFYNDIETLKRVPNAYEKHNIAVALGLPVEYLFPEELGLAITSGAFEKRTKELTRGQTAYLSGNIQALMITDGGIEAVISKVDNATLEGKISKVLGGLKPKEERILRLRFGLVDGKSRTLEEVALEFNVTRERIRQIESKALRRLRHHSRGLIKYYQGS